MRAGLAQGTAAGDHFALKCINLNPYAALSEFRRKAFRSERIIVSSPRLMLPPKVNDHNTKLLDLRVAFHPVIFPVQQY